MHRYAYVGADLQDLYGIDPRSIGKATTMANAYFNNRDAETTLAKLAATRDGVLVSEETVQDFQLQPGDTVNLRLQSAADHQYHVVPFTFVGVAGEFPTAPKDFVSGRQFRLHRRGDGDRRARSGACPRVGRRRRGIAEISTCRGPRTQGDRARRGAIAHLLKPHQREPRRAD